MKTHRPHVAMNILGITENPPMQDPFGGRDSYFPWPRHVISGSELVVWGGVWKACPDWVFGQSLNSCNITSGDPNRVLPYNKNCILRSITVWPAEATGHIRVRVWHLNASSRFIYMRFPCAPDLAYSFDFGVNGVEIGNLPFVRCNVEVPFSMVYDIK